MFSICLNASFDELTLGMEFGKSTFASLKKDA